MNHALIDKAWFAKQVTEISSINKYNHDQKIKSSSKIEWLCYWNKLEETAKFYEEMLFKDFLALKKAVLYCSGIFSFTINI